MRQSLKTARKISLYAAYGIVLTTALLYARFPSEDYVPYLQARIRELDPRLRTSIERVSPRFPLGLRVREPRVAREDPFGADLFAAREVQVTRGAASYLARRYDYQFDAMAYGGRIAGEAAFVENRPRSPFSATLRLEGLQLLEHAYLQAVTRQPVSGLLAGAVRFTGRQDAWMEAQGHADLTIRDGRVTLPASLWNIGAVHIDEARLELRLGERQLTVARIEIRGREIQGNLSGTVYLNEDIENSRLNLKGTVHPFPSLSKTLGGLLGGSFSARFGRGVSFVIHGTLTDPKIKVL